MPNSKSPSRSPIYANLNGCDEIVEIGSADHSPRSNTEPEHKDT